jgi:hypothetical protein
MISCGVAYAGLSCDVPRSEPDSLPAAQWREQGDDQEAGGDEEPGEPSPCGSGPVRSAALKLSWNLLPSDASEVALVLPQLTLRLENFSNSALEIHPTSVGYAAGKRIIHPSPVIVLEGGASSEIEVSFEIPSVDWSAALSPANLFVFADAVATSGGVLERAHSPVVYFHREAEFTHLYREKALQENHRRGDLKGLMPELHGDVQLVAVVDATAGLQIADLDGGKAEP